LLKRFHNNAEINCPILQRASN